MQLCVCVCLCVFCVCSSCCCCCCCCVLHAACVLADKICYSVEQHHLLSAPTTLSQNRSGEGETLNEAQRITNPYTSLRFQRSPANICVCLCVCGMCVCERESTRYDSQPTIPTFVFPFFLKKIPLTLWGRSNWRKLHALRQPRQQRSCCSRCLPSLPHCLAVASSRACAHASVDRHADA